MTCTAISDQCCDHRSVQRRLNLSLQSVTHSNGRQTVHSNVDRITTKWHPITCGHHESHILFSWKEYLVKNCNFNFPIILRYVGLKNTDVDDCWHFSEEQTVDEGNCKTSSFGGSVASNGSDVAPMTTSLTHQWLPEKEVLTHWTEPFLT